MKYIAFFTVAAAAVVGLILPGTRHEEAHSLETPSAVGPPTVESEADRSLPSAQDLQDQVDAAAARALEWLASAQDPSTGGWIQDVGFKFNNSYEVTRSGSPHVGVSALALMAFLAGGQLPSRGKYGDVVERGTDFILSCVNEDTGYISSYGTRMYSHAFATLYLAEVFGMTRRTELKRKLQQAVDLTVRSQNKQGSWRYRPYAPDSDMSIAVCQLMALRAARNIGIHVPRSTIDRAYGYIQQSAITAGRSRGAFNYQIDQPRTRTSFALTAAGLASLIHAGFYDDRLISPGIRFLRRRIQRLDSEERFPTYFYWYGHYYAAQVMFIASDREDQRGLWSEFYWPRMSRELLRYQSPDGSWANDVGPGTAYGTAVASIILQIPYEYLPILQR